MEIDKIINELMKLKGEETDWPIKGEKKFEFHDKRKGINITQFKKQNYISNTVHWKSKFVYYSRNSQPSVYRSGNWEDIIPKIIRYYKEEGRQLELQLEQNKKPT